MRVDNLLRDRETESGAAGLGCARFLDAVEALEQVRQILARDADAVVGYRNLDEFTVGSRLKLDFAAVRSVFYRVGYDVDYDLLDALLVGYYLGQLTRLERQLVRMRGGFDPA